MKVGRTMRGEGTDNEELERKTKGERNDPSPSK